jgi:lactate permease
MAGMTAVYGAAYGLMPIGWIILNVIFLYQLTKEKGEFDVLQGSIRGISDDRRLQLLFIAFSFGAFFEGAAGFGTPVAVTAAMLIGLGFSPLSASGLSLIANTGTGGLRRARHAGDSLAAVTGLDLLQLSGMIGRQLPFFSVIVPIWLIWAFVGFRRMMEVFPALLVAGISFAIPQYLVSNFHGPWLVDVVAAIVSMVCLACSCASGTPRRRCSWPRATGPSGQGETAERQRPGRAAHGRPLGGAGLDALGHPERARLRLGHAAGEGVARQLLDRQDPGGRPAPADREGAAGGGAPVKEAASTT